jgi:hypothetical protein
VLEVVPITLDDILIELLRTNTFLVEPVDPRKPWGANRSASRSMCPAKGPCRRRLMVHERLKNVSTKTCFSRTKDLNFGAGEQIPSIVPARLPPAIQNAPGLWAS